MKKNNIISFIAICLLASTTCFAEYPEANLVDIGYSDELIDVVDEEIGLTYIDEDDDDDEEELSEVDSTVEQLKELGVSRSITENRRIQSQALREKNEAFWNRVRGKSEQETKGVIVSEETKALIKSNISDALTSKGYKIVQLDIIPLAEYSTKNAVRAVVRVVKPMKRGSYNEVQTRLNEIKDICMTAATINGHCMLSEMTTFVAENPKNNYYYEKTILR